MTIRKATIYGKLETQSGKSVTKMNDGSPFMTALLQTEFGAVEVMLRENGLGSVSLYDGPQVNASQLQRPTGRKSGTVEFVLPTVDEPTVIAIDDPWKL